MSNKEKIKPKYFQCYLDNITILEHLSDEEAGQLWKLLYNLAVNDEKGSSGNPLVSMAFDMMAKKLEAEFSAYEKKVLTNKRNGRKGGLAKAEKSADAAERCQTLSELSQYEDEDENENENENENKNEDKIKTSAEADADAAADAVFLFERSCPGMPKAGRLTKRKRELISRARSALGGTDFEEYFSRVARSDFLTGRSGKWLGCTLDWLLKPDTIQKVLDGFYDNRAAPQQPCSRSASYDIEELERIDTLEFLSMDS